MGFEEELEEPNSTPLRLSLFPQRFSSPEMEGGFTPPPHTRATIPFQWEETPGKPRSITTSDSPQTVRSLDLPPRMFVNSAIATPTNNGKTKVEIVWSPTSVLEGQDSITHSWSSSGKSKWKMMMMLMPLRKMIMCKETPSLQLRSWSWGSFTDISSRDGSLGSPSWSFDDLSNSLESKAKITKLSRRRSLVFFNKTTCSILESMNHGIIQAVPWRR